MSELIACPECKKHLQVPDHLLGKTVQCPECRHTFVAVGVETEVAPRTSTATTSSKPPPLPAWEQKSKSASKRRQPDEDDDAYDIDDRDDDDEYDDDRPRRRSGRRRSRRFSARGSDYLPHRGGMILAFGLIAVVVFIPGVSLVLGIIAWVMANNDLAAIRAGDMDPSGEGTTRAGQIMGIIATLLHLLGFAGCCCWTFAIGVAGNANNPRRRF